MRASLVTYKGRPGDGPLRHEDLDDLRVLVRHEVDRRGLSLDWRNGLPAESAADRTLTRQIVLNLLLNACAASPGGAAVRLDARTDTDGTVLVDVADAGSGLPQAGRALLDAPDAPPPEGGGLGLWIASRLAHRLGGRIRALPVERGTCLRLEVPAARLQARPEEAFSHAG